MPPVAFGGGATETVLGPFVAVCMVFAIALILVLPRKYVLAPLMFGLLLCPAGQALFLGGLHLFVTRILILVGWIRVNASKVTDGKNGAARYSLDKIFLLWAIFRAASFLIRYPQVGAFINQAGFLIDVLGGFFLIRALVQDDEDVQRIIKVLAAVAIVLAVTMSYEEVKGVNIFGIIGRSPVIPEVRNGFVRAQGPFEHALLAGTFAATLLPLFFWLWKSGRSKLLGLAGMGAVTIIPFITQCSTPILAYGAAVFGICFWPFRKLMRLVRWGIVGSLIGLQLVMKANVWWIIQHLDVVGGSSGWHRAELVDEFLRHFFDWWLVGTSNNASWGHMTWDICNQYVAEGETGGLITFGLFVAVICVGFKWLGVARKSVEGDTKKEWYYWALASALFAHVIAYFGISYFDQTRFSWYTLLVVISVATAPVRSAEFGREVVQEGPQEEVPPVISVATAPVRSVEFAREVVQEGPQEEAPPSLPRTALPAQRVPPSLTPGDEYSGVLNILKRKLPS
jgi:hypothetical protein